MKKQIPVQPFHHGGENTDRIQYDFSVSLNPLGIPACAVRAMDADRSSFEDYPDTDCSALRQRLSEILELPAGQIVCGAGAVDLIYRLPAALDLKKVLLYYPSFTEYERALRMHGTEICGLFSRAENDFAPEDEFLSADRDADAVIISDPVNPSGRLMDQNHYRLLLEWCVETGTTLITDECFMDFLPQEKRREREAILRSFPELDLIRIRSFTKIYAMAGLRIGFALFRDAGKAGRTAASGPPWNVPGPALKAALAALSDDTGYLWRTGQLVRHERKKLAKDLAGCGFRVYQSDANFLLFEGPAFLGPALESRGIKIRECSDYRGLQSEEKLTFYRVAVRSGAENRMLLEAVRQISDAGERDQTGGEGLETDTVRKKGALPASIMIQGTMSNAGKSLITAGLCRIFRQDGYRPAPFKSQNMALNSFITADGKEIGRAQAVQAEAAGTDPQTDMNPILLKPTTEKGSQVIVNGEVRCSMDAADYFEFRKSLKQDVMSAYERLGNLYDIIVIEGAGSPVEINLTKNSDDFVNMGLAAMTGSPVLMVGDIDRGGVFAQLGGTMMLLDGADRSRVKGVIVNKFRGDLSLFEEGKEMLAAICGVPAVGVVPYADLDIDDEDSLSSRLSVQGGKSSYGKDPDREELQIRIIRLPHISNFSDMTALDAAEGVRVIYVDRPEQIRHADAVIIPGSKNTMGDLRWLRDCGMAGGILEAAENGIPVIGICGGFQMMGRKILDQSSVEGSLPEMEGLGLLPVCTEYMEGKQTRQVTARTADGTGLPEELRGLEISGYEIHMGRSRILSDTESGALQEKKGSRPGLPGRRGPAAEDNLSCFSYLENGEPDGCAAGNVLGTYLHGLFDNKEFTEACCRWIARVRGKDLSVKAVDYNRYKEAQYDKLAELLRKSLDLDYIYEIMGLPGKKRSDGETG
ncbi:MAG: cobyric acid synthase [Firmicutes bacterium]|nr:cobyric acid synthase [Bacillota bacterium]